MQSAIARVLGGTTREDPLLGGNGGKQGGSKGGKKPGGKRRTDDYGKKYAERSRVETERPRKENDRPRKETKRRKSNPFDDLENPFAAFDKKLKKANLPEGHARRKPKKK